MQLFNFDLIVPEQQCTPGLQQQQQDDPDAAPPLCYVVDINFFPGVDKIPDFEQRFVQFLLAAAASEPAGADCAPGKQPQQQQQQQLQQGAEAAAAPVSSCGARASCAGVAAAPEGPAPYGSSSSPGKSQDPRPSSRRSSSSCGGATTPGVMRNVPRSEVGCYQEGGSTATPSSRRLQHSLSAGHTAAAAGSGSGHGRRHSSGSGASSGGSSRHGGSSGSSGLAAAVTAGQWGDRAAGLGSSPPPQLQVAGCS